jgi:hypothetical protein
LSGSRCQAVEEMPQKPGSIPACFYSKPPGFNLAQPILMLKLAQL